MRFAAKLLSSTIAFAVAFSPMASAGQFVFRYKTQSETLPDTPLPEEEYGVGNDITAYYVAPVGVAFSKRIPVATHDVVLWVKDSGSWPGGIGIDAATGAMSGSPTGNGTSALLYHGIDAQGHRIARARLNFTTFTPVGIGQRIDAYAHKDRYFYQEIPVPAGVDVYRWEPVGDLPEAVSMLGNAVQGTPPAAGEFGFAWRGFDYTGREIAYAYGDLTVEDGPAMNFIAGQTVQIDDAWNFNLTPTVKHPINPVRFRLVAETPQPSGLTFNASTGRIGGVYSWYDLSATYHIVAVDQSDGTEAASNSFKLATAPKVLDLASQMRDITTTVGKDFAQKVAIKNQSAGVVFSLKQGTWPDGISINPSTGVISGKPTKIETQLDLVVAVSGPSMQPVESAPFAFKVVAEQIVATAGPVLKRVGESFTTSGFTLESGKTAPLSFEAAAALEAGVTLDRDTGIVSAPQGIATAGSYGIPVVITNGDGASATVLQPIDILNNLRVAYDSVVSKRLVPVSIVPSVAADSVYGTAKYALASGTLPPWLSLDSKTGSIRGTPVDPTSVGSYGPFTVTVSDSTGQTSAPSDPFLVTVGDRDALSADVVNAQVERFVPNQKVTLKAVNAYKKPVFSQVSGNLGGTLSITSDGVLVGSTDDAIGTVYPGLVYQVSDADALDVPTQTFSISVVEPAALAPLTGSLDKTLTWTRGVPIPVGKLALPQVRNGYGAIAYAFAAPEPNLVIDPATHDVTGAIYNSGTTTHVYTIDDETARPAASGTITLVMLDPLEASIPGTTEIPRGSAASIVPAVRNAIGHITWQQAGTLPLGLTFTDGAITGVPRVEGNYPVSFSLSDESGNTATVSTTIVVGPALPFSVAWDDEAFIFGKDGTKLPSVTNPLGTVSYELASGRLPAGLSLVTTGSLSGAIAGTPTEAGRFKDIRIRATDLGLDPASAADDTVIYTTIEVDVTLSGVVVFNDQTVTARKGVTFSKTLAASNVVAPLAFEMSDGKPMPYDLVLNRTTGTITGKFDETGTYGPVLVKVTDDLDRSDDAGVRFDVLGPFSLQTPLSASFTQYVSGSTAIPTTNKLGPISYSLKAGTLPDGLSINSSTGAVEGKASQTGDFSGIVISATDADGSTASTEPFSIHVDQRPALTLDLPASYVFNQFFAGSVAGKGANILDAAQWSISPALPSWATFAGGTISGTSDVKMPATTYTVTLKDDHDTVSKQIDVSVGDRKPLEITTADVIPALLDYDFLKKLSAKDGRGTVTWRLVSGTLPEGIRFTAASGAFEGKPTEYGTFGNVVIEATDEKGGLIQKSFTIDVKHDQSPISLTVTPANAHAGLAIDTVAPSLDNAVGDLAFSAAGLPAGLDIDPATGKVTGTPSAAGTYQVSVTVSDATGRSATRTQAITVLPPVSITVPSGTVGITYNRDPSAANHASANNALPSNAWVLASGTLPKGLSIDATTGAFAGKAKELGDFGPFTVKVVDSLGGTATSSAMNLHVEMNDDPIVLSVADYTTYLDKPITTATPTFDNELGSVTFFSADVAALGLSIDPKTGVITGARSTLTDAYINVSIRDSGTQRVTSQPLRLRVVPELRITYPALMTTSQGASFSQAVSIGNNIGTITYGKGAGTWPDSFAINPQTGAITGTDIAADAKTYAGLTVAADVVFNGGQTDSQFSNTFSITVGPIQAAPVISDVNSTAANKAVLFTVGSAGTEFKPTVVDSAKGKPWIYGGTTYSLNHDIKADTGLDFDAKTGIISGTATTPFIYKDLTITVTALQGSDTTAPFWLGVQPSGPIVATAGQPTWFGARADKTTVIPGPKFDNTFGKLTFTSLQGVTTGFDTATGAYTSLPFANSAVTSQPAGGWPEDVRVTDEFGRTAVFSAKWELMYALTITTTATVGAETGKANSLNVPTIGGLYAVKSFTGVGMPTGMTINASTGALEGTPVAGDVGKMFDVTVTVRDSKDGETKSSTYKVGVAAGPITPTAGQTTTLRFRMDEDGVFSFKFDNVVGTPTYSQPASYASVINPSTGVVTSKAPFAPSTYTGPAGAWTGNLYYVTDALGRTGTITYSVTNVYGITISSAASVVVNPGVATAANAPTVANVYGTKTFAGTGMPTGMTINPTTGALTGTPLASDQGKSFTVTVTVTDGYDGKSKSSTYTAYVAAPLKTTSGQTTQFYARTGGDMWTLPPQFDGAYGALTFALITTPGGLKLDAVTGQILPISGTAGFIAGNYTIVTRATDALARSADLTVNITTVGALGMTAPTTPTLVVGKSYSAVSPPTVTNKGMPTFTATGLPPGITVNPTTGGLTGTPTTAGSYTVALTLVDLGATVTRSYTVNVIP